MFEVSYLLNELQLPLVDENWEDILTEWVITENDTEAKARDCDDNCSKNSWNSTMERCFRGIQHSFIHTNSLGIRQTAKE